jgi:hypothetical protein
MKRSFKIAMSFAALIVIGCGTPDILYLPGPPRELVINCIGYNYHQWEADLSLSSGILEGHEDTVIADATIKLYEDGVLLETLVTDGMRTSPGGTRYYSVTSTPQPGKRYKLTAERPGFPTAEAEYLQPDSIAIAALAVQVIGPNPNFPGTTDVQIRVQFDDPPGEDFYEIDAIHVLDSIRNSFPGEDTVYLSLSTDDLGLTFIDPAYEENNEGYYSAISFNDSYFDGKSVTLDFKAQVYEASKKTYVVYLRHLSKAYYNYLKTVGLQSTTAGDPFAQPVLLENNITNGYGIFGGYTQVKKPVQAGN